MNARKIRNELDYMEALLAMDSLRCQFFSLYLKTLEGRELRFTSYTIDLV